MEIIKSMLNIPPIDVLIVALWSAYFTLALDKRIMKKKR